MSKRKSQQGGLIYSTNPDFKPEYGEKETEDISASRQDLRVWLERKGGGKLVTSIRGFIGKSETLEELARLLKSKCGVGGSSKDGEILIQGDQRDKIIAILTEKGFKARKAGG